VPKPLASRIEPYVGYANKQSGPSGHENDRGTVSFSKYPSYYESVFGSGTNACAEAGVRPSFGSSSSNRYIIWL